jgi:Fe-S cluster assembly protein SufB
MRQRRFSRYTSFISTAGDHLLFLFRGVQAHPDLVKKYLGSVVPYSDNFFALERRGLQ